MKGIPIKINATIDGLGLVSGEFRYDIGYASTRMDPEEYPEISEVMSVTVDGEEVSPSDFWDKMDEADAYDEVCEEVGEEYDRGRSAAMFRFRDTCNRIAALGARLG